MAAARAAAPTTGCERRGSHDEEAGVRIEITCIPAGDGGIVCSEDIGRQGVRHGAYSAARERVGKSWRGSCQS